MYLFSKKIAAVCAAVAMSVAMTTTAWAAGLTVKTETIKAKGVTLETPQISGARGGAAIDNKVNMLLWNNSFKAMLGMISTKTLPSDDNDFVKTFGNTSAAKENTKQMAEYMSRRLENDRVKVGQKEPYFVKLSYDVKTGLQNSTISLVEKVTTYTGGAHNNTEYLAVNYDLRSGKEIQLADIFAEGVNYQDRLLTLMQIQAKGDQRIYNKLTENVKNAKPEGYYCPKKITGKEKFYLDAKVGDLTVFYNPGEIAPISEGRMNFRFSLDTISDLIRL